MRTVSARLSPSTYSMTRNGPTSDSATSKTPTMFGSRSDAAIAAIRRKRSATSGSLRPVRGQRLHRDVTVQLRVAGEVHLGRGGGADAVPDLVATGKHARRGVRHRGLLRSSAPSVPGPGTRGRDFGPVAPVRWQNPDPTRSDIEGARVTRGAPTGTGETRRVTEPSGPVRPAQPGRHLRRARRRPSSSSTSARCR